MPPKSRKRKVSDNTDNTATNGDDATPPDRNTWPGWVEMESEPAFFNVMLKDMGVHGVKINEVWSLDDNDLAILPQPVHALIFLFRYRETDKDDLEEECPEHVWYAEQVPDFACATVALLNIVNNIPGLEMGKHLRTFKEFTQDMSPRDRGDAIDEFDFVKRIHNSFAREADILQADMYTKEKADKARKRQAVAKARKTRLEKAAARKDKSSSPVATPTGTRVSGRVRRSTVKVESELSPKATPQSPRSSARKQSAEGSPADPEDPESKHPNDEDAKTNGATATPCKTNGAGTPTKESKTPATALSKTNGAAELTNDELSDPVTISSPPEIKANISRKLKLNAPKTKPKVDPNADFSATIEDADPETQPRRSGRQPKPRQDLQATIQAEAEAEEEGFHFCAYMPIGDRVWKLDGMDRFPQDMGPIEAGNDWLSIAQPALQDRIAQYAAGAIEFNLMAVVHDPMVACVEALAANVKALQAVEEKLVILVEDWKEMLDSSGESDITVGPDVNLGLQNVDIERVEMTPRDAKGIAEAEDLVQLLELRKEIVLQQCGLRRACKDEMECVQSDAAKARSRRHDYSQFAREWVGALADAEILGALLEEES